MGGSGSSSKRARVGEGAPFNGAWAVKEQQGKNFAIIAKFMPYTNLQIKNKKQK